MAIFSDEGNLRRKLNEYFIESGEKARFRSLSPASGLEKAALGSSDITNLKPAK